MVSASMERGPRSVGSIPNASSDWEPPQILRKTAYTPIPRTPPKTIRARVTREKLGIAPWRLDRGSTTSSGESSLVKASLKVNAANTSAPTSETEIERGFRPKGFVSRRWSQP